MSTSPEYVVIGGGEWGCHHVRLLLRALRNDRLEPGTVIVVDRDEACAATRLYGAEPAVTFEFREWAPFLSDYLSAVRHPEAAYVVPSPHAPHIFLEWIEQLVRERHGSAVLQRGRFEAELSLPFQYTDGSGNTYLSGAAWECPVTCREPAVCPAIRARRTWEIGDVIARRAASSSSPLLPLVWRTRRLCPGISAVSAADLLGAVRRLEEGEPRGRAALATVSACHGVVAVLEYDLSGSPRP